MKKCIGKMDKRVIIKQRSTNEPSFDDISPEIDFTTIKTVWANISATSGNPINQQLNTENQPTHKILMRWSDGIDNSLWYEHDGINYKPVRIIDIEGNPKYVEISVIRTGRSTKNGASY